MAIGLFPSLKNITRVGHGGKSVIEGIVGDLNRTGAARQADKAIIRHHLAAHGHNDLELAARKNQ